MGIVRAEITLKNGGDITRAGDGFIKESEIRQATVTAMVDTGAITLVINDELREQLGLKVQGERWATFANDTREMVKIAEPVRIYWKNRSMICEPLVVSDNGEILLGAIPLEDMDLMVDPVHQVLTGVHGEEIVSMLK